MVAVAEQVGNYLGSFEKLQHRLSDEPAWLRQSRQHAMQRFSDLGFPTTRDEEFKYTSFASLSRVAFRPAAATDHRVSAEKLAPFAFNELGGRLLVFVDGRYTPDLSRVAEASNGDEVSGLAEALAAGTAELEEHLARYTAARENAFAALNTAFIDDGALIRIPDRAVVEEPIHLLFVSTANEPDTFTSPRVLILAGRDSQAAVIESYVAIRDGAYWTNAATEIVAGENARLDHYRIQREQPRAFHTSFLEIRQARNGNVTTHALSLGGRLARHDIEVVLEDEGGECTLNGLYAVNGEQHVDNRTCIDHTKPHCTSHQLYKGVLDGRSRGVFSGKIIVRPDAQKTDAYQNNKNLLLSEDADINTKPQLQIDANDVKCSHGATVGQIDEEAIFYLRSRGIGHDEARGLLTYAFAADVLERVKLDPVREHIETALMNWLTAPHPTTQVGDKRRG